MKEQLLAGGEACRRAEEAFLQCVRENEMEPLLSRGVLLALSGGADSVLLFHLLRVYTGEKNIPFAACHVHHCIRAEEADRDAAFAERLAKENGVPFFLAREDAPAFLKGEGHGRGLECAAREVRYAAIRRVMGENPLYGVCATAHNATDNLETILLHMVRGSGLRGMCGIPPVREHFVRPLLLLAKRDVLAALGELSAPYVTDSTNESTEYARNYLRAEVIPRLFRLTPDPEASASRLSANLRGEEQALSDAARDFCRTHLRGGAAPRGVLAALSEAVFYRVLLEMCRKAGFPEQPERLHVRELHALLRSGPAVGQYTLPGGATASFDRHDLTLFSRNTPAPDYETELSMGQNILPRGAGELWLFETRNEEFENRKSNVYNLFIQAKLDSATILGRLIARTRREGDSYVCGGMTRRVRRLMTDAKIPHVLRRILPVVCDESGILWVPGFGVRDGNGSGTGLYAYYCYR
ncbi:MAG: tRNA lysidine(34) synthetase TilS [Clostridia bacterium]|nr:tRNA lysidine(34) synthetase TilS [Clostridia bacterium]